MTNDTSEQPNLTDTASLKRGRERLTWFILLVCFAACIGLCLSVPLGANWFVQSSQRRLHVWGRGTFGKPSTTLGEILLPEDAERRYRTPIGLITGGDEQGLFEIRHPDSDWVVAQIEVRGDSSANVDVAAFPRFARSSDHPELTIGIPEGSVRIKIPESNGSYKQLLTYVNTPNGHVVFDKPGTYTVAFTNNVMRTSVYDGRAYLRSDTDELVLQPGERGELAADLRTTGPFATEINLITNSDFSERYTNWTTRAFSTERDDQPPVNFEIVDVNGQAAARFQRDGEGNASVQLRQTIERSIRDFDDMRLNVTMGVNNQSLEVCGVAGTECPMTIRIDYLDVNGQQRAWQQGFYVRGDAGEQTPNFCKICGSPLSLSIHQKLPQPSQVFPLNGTSNLIEVLAQENMRPDTVQALTLKAEGHSFAVDVFDIELIVSENAVEQESADES